MLNHPKLTMRVLLMLMHLSSGHMHVTLLPKEFQFLNVLFNRTYGIGRTHAFAQLSSCSYRLLAATVSLIRLSPTLFVAQVID